MRRSTLIEPCKCMGEPEVCKWPTYSTSLNGQKYYYSVRCKRCRRETLEATPSRREAIKRWNNDEVKNIFYDR